MVRPFQPLMVLGAPTKVDDPYPGGKRNVSFSAPATPPWVRRRNEPSGFWRMAVNWHAVRPIGSHGSNGITLHLPTRHGERERARIKRRKYFFKEPDRDLYGEMTQLSDVTPFSSCSLALLVPSVHAMCHGLLSSSVRPNS